ncbi:conserved hypothetical protein, partial [Acidovorax delafieldii 2AN]
MADGFLGRWSQRKQNAREGRPLQEPTPVTAPPIQPTVMPGGPQGPGAQAAVAP